MIDEPNIIVYDIESAGVNALNADLGYIITFAYITLKDFEKGKKWTSLSITDYPRYKTDPHDDRCLLKDILKVLNKATHIIHHYGKKFDEPFIRTRLMMTKIGSFPEVPELDTCFLAWKKLKLSSNRLANIAKVLKCKYQKIDKKDGWPNWWLDYLKGGTKYDKEMRRYNGYDVMTLAEISLRMRPYWPRSFINFGVHNNKRCCKLCGCLRLKSHGRRIVGMRLYQILKCQKCGYSWNKIPIPGKRGEVR